MLNEKELLEFLRLLAAFTDAIGVSATNCGLLLNVSKKTLCRWLAAAYAARDNGEAPAHSVYRYQAYAVMNQINHLNGLDASEAIYSKIMGLKPAEKLRVLSSAMDTSAAV